MVTQLLLYFKHIRTPEILLQKTEHISQNIILHLVYCNSLITFFILRVT